MKKFANAYAQGYGLALAMDLNLRRTLFGPTFKERVAEGKLDQWGNEVQNKTDVDKAELQRIRESGERLDFKSAGAVRRRPAKDQVTDPPGGANATAHGAKHEVARAELAGKTGVTGGPPTNKGSKVPTGKQPLIMPKMSWPSSDAELSFQYRDYKVYKLESGKYQVWWKLRVNLGTFASEDEAEERIRRHQQTTSRRL